MNRSNSFVNALKWWPLQGHNGNNNNNHSSTATVTNGVGVANGGGHQGTFGALGLLHHSKSTTYGSSVAVQKLRESKWFKRDEQRIFCAVVECGFIVEIRDAAAAAAAAASHHMPQNSFDDDDEDEDLAGQDENETPVTSWFGIVLCKTAKDHKPKPETIEIYSVKLRENSHAFKMIKMSLEDIWNNGWELRINNFADKEKQAHNEKDIRNQVSFARKAKQSLWNNNKHFVYWCRYGSRQQDVRKRQMSECVKWGSVGMNAGILLVMNKQKSYSTSK